MDLKDPKIWLWAMKHFQFLDIYEDWTSDPKCRFTGRLGCCNLIVDVVWAEFLPKDVWQ